MPNICIVRITSESEKSLQMLTLTYGSSASHFKGESENLEYFPQAFKAYINHGGRNRMHAPHV